MITKEHVGKRLLLKNADTLTGILEEGTVRELAPSGAFALVRWHSGNDTWVAAAEYEVVEELPQEHYPVDPFSTPDSGEVKP